MSDRRALLAVTCALLVVVSLPAVTVPAHAGMGTSPAQTTSPTSDLSAIRQRPRATTTQNHSQYVVVFANASARRSSAINQTGATVTGGWTVDLLPVLFITGTSQQAAALESLPGVAYVTKNKRVEIGSTVSNASVASTASQDVPWGITKINGREAARSVPISAQQNVTVAVLDTGIDIDHPDLDDNLVWGANFSNNVTQYGLATADDNEGHGTAAAGLLAAENNSQAIVGVAPHVRLYAIKVVDESGTAFYSWIIKGLEAAIEGEDRTLGTADDADVISMSLGGDTDSQFLKDAIENASKHAVLVAAAGNSGDDDSTTNEVKYPAKYSEVIAVAATDTDNTTTTFSAEGGEVEIAAPGVYLTTTSRGGGTTSFTGTSASAPLVSGVMALLIAEDRSDGARTLSSGDLRDLIHTTALDIDTSGVDKTSGYGLIRAATAVSKVEPNIPSADAGSDVSAVENTSVTLDGSASSDPNGDSLSYSWTQTSGLAVSLQDANTATPEFTAPSVDETRTLTFELTVSDGNGNSDTDTVNVTVSPANTPPTADAGLDQTVAENTSVTLDGTNSTDSDGDTLAYSWSQTSGPSVTLQDSQTATPTFTTPSVSSTQTLTFELTVSDGQTSDSALVNITVSPTNNPPTADAGNNQSVMENTTITLNGTGSTDPDSDSLSYTWTQTSGPSVTLQDSATATPSFTAPNVSANRTLVFKLNVSDDHGGWDTDTVAVTVSNSDGSNITVELRPQNASVGANDTIKYAVVATNITDGVGAYNLSLTIDNASIAGIENVTLQGNPGFKTISYGPANDSVQLVASLANTADTGTVTIANITVIAESQGQTTANLSVVELANEFGVSYQLETVTDATMTVGGTAQFQLSNVDAPVNVTSGENATVTATIENTGTVQDSQQITLQFNGTTVTSKSLTLAPGQLASLNFTVNTTGVDAGTYTFVVRSEDDIISGQLTIEAAVPPALPGFQNTPNDTDDDGVYEDVNGDGTVNIADVQALFANRNSDAVQNNQAAFDFNNDGTFNIADVQTLFVAVTS